MNRSYFPAARAVLVATAFALMPDGFASEAGESRERPNVVLVMTDDQGYGDLGCHGNPILRTPHLDALHAESVRLTDYHVSPTCSPTRASLLTGRYAHRVGVWHTINGRSLLSAEEKTLDQYFDDAGYATGMFGKWHLGDNFPMRPEDRGFEEVFRHGGGGIAQSPDLWDNTYFGGRWTHNGKVVERDGFCTGLFFDAAIDFIREAAETDRPFFAYIPLNAAHRPFHAPPEKAAPYAEQGVKVANFFGMIADIDDHVGRLRAFLDEHGLAENTILIFTTDNGSAAGWKLYNAGMRAGKGTEWEGGHRVPFFVHWPAGGLTGGRDVEALTAHVDVLPTVAEFCDVPLDPPAPLDGTSLVPLLKGEEAGEESAWADRVLVTGTQRVPEPIKWRKTSVMSGPWRLVNETGLYHVGDDPGQRKNIAADHREVVARLTAAYDEIWESMSADFDRVARIEIGGASPEVVDLTAHDVTGVSFSAYSQQIVREGGCTEAGGTWRLEVGAPGRYRISLARWPHELDRPLTEALPPGPDVPGEKAFTAYAGAALAITAGRVAGGGIESIRPASPGAASVEFDVELAAGPLDLTAELIDADGVVRPSYFVRITGPLGDRD